MHCSSSLPGGRFRIGAVVVVAVLAAPVLPVSAAFADGGSAGHVYEASNAAAGNAVQVFDRLKDGTLVPGAVVPTGGLGAGASLASQGGVVRDDDHLLVVNAGDNTVTSFTITGGGLKRRDVAPSGGTRPVSVTVHDGLVYVLNVGSDSISALKLSDSGRLTPVVGSSRPLSGTGTGAAEVLFDRSGRSLVVTEKATNRVDVFAVGKNGLASGPTVTQSSGLVPYGFDINARGAVVVSEAATGSVSSYRLVAGQLQLVTGSLSDSQAAPCWLVLSRDGRYAYTTNAASGTVSAYRVASDGSLTLLAAVAGTPGTGPTDVAVSSDGRYLHARVRNGDVASYAIASDGTLSARGTATGITSIGSSGLATD